MRVILVIGTRPQIIKSASVVDAARENRKMELEIIHTGQHYDFQMSKIFFDEMDLADPIVNLGVGSGGHGWQTGQMLIALEKALLRIKPDIVLVPGDTNSTLAASLAATKLQFPVVHIEAGARSYDSRMPEEINRILTDHCSSLLFTPSRNCCDNLAREGIAGSKVYCSGDTMYDALLEHLPSARTNPILRKIDVKPKEYVFLTLHRPENVDNPAALENIVNAVLALDDFTIVFAVHPRTKRNLEKGELIRRLTKARHIKLVSPVSYHESLKLVMDARSVLTDSGGLQKESFWLCTPCVTMRENTEWIETIRMGSNVLVGSNMATIVESVRKYASVERMDQKLWEGSNPYGDGKAGKGIIRTLEQLYT